nr:hypothetical protein [uncultured Methanoregula sp.]
MPEAQLNVWSRDEGTPFLNLNEESDPDDLCPEGDVTKPFWKTLFARIEIWRREFNN